MNETLKRTAIFILMLGMVIAGTRTMAQQTPVFSQYFFNELVINPAYAGSQVQLSLTSTYRNQWVNFPGAPRTFSFSGHSSVYHGKVGIGLLANVDKIGSYNNQNVYAYYSYKINFRTGTLSLGLQGGFNFLGADYSKLDLSNTSDPSFSSFNTYKPNFGAGLYYSQKNFFVGFSVPYLMNTTSVQSIQNDALKISTARYYFLRSGVIISLDSKQNIKFNPSFLVRAQEGQPLSFDLNAGFILYDLLNTGVSWRSGDSFITFIDIKISEKFHFAYSYDWTASDISRYSNGTHEFMINYRAKVTRAQKSMPCPSFFQYNTLGPKGSKRFNAEKK